MQVKGSVIKTISNFVEKEYKQDFKTWLNRLPGPSKKIYKGAILATDWYPIKEGVILPTELISSMFYDDPKNAAWDSGYSSAAQALTGVYKVFVLVSKPSFLMARASKVLSSFYSPTELVITESGPKYMVIHITKFPEPNVLVEYRIAGWMQKALEICGCKSLSVKITKSMTAGDKVTEYSINWE